MTTIAKYEPSAMESAPLRQSFAKTTIQSNTCQNQMFKSGLDAQPTAARPWSGE